MHPVRVKILAAKGLLAAGPNGTSDPYVVMSLLNSKDEEMTEGGTFKTQPARRTVNPEWNEEFVIGDKMDLRGATTLRLKIMDLKTVLADEVLGVVDIPVHIFVNLEETIDNWYQVTKFRSMRMDATGELHVVLESAAKVRKANLQAPNMLVVSLESGNNLLAMDDNGTSSDPFVTLTLGDQKHRSTVHKKTLKPHWNEKFVFEASSNKEKLSLQVEDEDITINDFIGRADVELKQLEPHVKTPMTLTLGNSKGKKDKLERGTLSISLLWTFHEEAAKLAKKKETSVLTQMMTTLNLGVPDADEDVYSGEDETEDQGRNDKQKVMTDEERRLKEEEERKRREEVLNELRSIEVKSGDYTIHVHVLEARDLVPKDATGTSDPVVYVTVLDEEQQTMVKNQTLSCVWDDLLIFNMRNLDKSEVEMGFVRLDVMDANTVQRAELIGSAQFDLSYIYSQRNHMLANAWLGLTDMGNMKNKGIQGYLRASISIVGPGDKLITPPDPWVLDDPGANLEVLMPKSVEQSVNFVAVTVHRAEHLPPMDVSVLASNRGLDAYVAASIAGESPVRTRVKSRKGDRKKNLNASFHEDLVLVVREPSMADSIHIGVYDWDKVGENESVGFIYQSVKAVKACGGRMGPFWANIYGGPLLGLSVGTSVLDQMNRHPEMGTTYRGRVLLSLRMLENEDNDREEVNRKENAKKLPRDLYPKTRVYRMRAHFVLGSEIPRLNSAKHLGQNSKMQLVMTCGLEEIASIRAKNKKGVVEWNTMVESEKMIWPEDTSQIPDIFLYLCHDVGGDRKSICFQRFSARDLMMTMGGFKSDVQWISMKEDNALDALKDSVFPGNVLLRMGFGTDEEWKETVWDEKEVETVRLRHAYQLRVHIYQGRRLPAADANGLLNPYLTVHCMEEESQNKSIKKQTRDPVWYETQCFDVLLPDLKYAPQVLLRVMHLDPFVDEFIGRAALNISDAHVRSSEDVRQGRKDKLPDPKWYPIMLQEPGDTQGELLASLELVKKEFPDEQVPRAPRNFYPPMRKAWLELTVLGLRSMEPFEFLPIQMPFVEFVLGGRNHASQEMVTDRSKRPSGRDANFLQRIVKEVELPDNPMFAPRLNAIVRDTRLGGFREPIVGSTSIDLKTKIPWSKDYREPQSDHFAEIEFESGDEMDDDEENIRSTYQKAEPLITTNDNGAGVFGALKSMGLDNDTLLEETSSRRSKSTNGDDDQDFRKYLRHRELLESDLESELKTAPFEKYALHIGKKKRQQQSMLSFFKKERKATGDSAGGGGLYKIAGHFKGLVRVMTREDESPLLDFDRLLRVMPYEIRVYVLNGEGFAPMDIGLNGQKSNSDPYLRLTLGKHTQSDRKNFIPDKTDPDFYKMWSFNASLPGASLLEIEAMDHDYIGGDDLIGRTTIDLEDRLFDTRWQEMGKSYQTKNRLAPKPLERRDIRIPTSRNPMGKMSMWVDILTPEAAHTYPPVDVSLPPPVDMELRVVIWKAKEVPSFDKAEDMNDLYFRCWMEGNDPQETDIHWRAQKGVGSFNWRMKFPLVLGHNQMHSKIPYFRLQGWDKDVFSANDAIGEETINLKQYFDRAYKEKCRIQCFEDSPEEARKKKKSADNDEDAVRKIREATGLWNDMDPPDSKWFTIKKYDHASGQRSDMGQVCISMELVPDENAKQMPVGFGRNEPNNSPYLPPPAGRLSWSLNPYKVLNQLLGPRICHRLTCCFCLVLFIIIIYFLAPFINVAIVTLSSSSK